MSYPPSKSRPPFVELSKKKRSFEYIRLQRKITCDAATFGGHFTSRLHLDEPGRPDIYNQWFSFYFLGSDECTIWNAYIRSAKKYFWEEVEGIARDQALSMLTDREREAEFSRMSGPSTRSSTGQITGYKLMDKVRKGYKQFEGRTYSEQCKKIELEIINNEPPAIYESFQLDRSYVYGIGLDIVVDANVINQAVIEQVITRFRDIGERNWISETPVPRESLPYTTESEALEEAFGNSAWIGRLVR